MIQATSKIKDGQKLEQRPLYPTPPQKSQKKKEKKKPRILVSTITKLCCVSYSGVT